MESGFDKDPQFEIIYMPPGTEEKENEWPETGAPEAEKKDPQDAPAEQAER